MKALLFLSLFLTPTLQNLEVVQPTSLRAKFHYDNKEGAINYTVSTFGDIPYTEKEYIQILLPPAGNKNGCDSLEKPSTATESDKIVWMVERGECTYSKKAFMAQQSGAYAVLVYHNVGGVNIENVIPCSDSVCGLKRQQLEDPYSADHQRRWTGGETGFGNEQCYDDDP